MEKVRFTTVKRMDWTPTVVFLAGNISCIQFIMIYILEILFGFRYLFGACYKISKKLPSLEFVSRQPQKNKTCPLVV